MLPRQNTTAVPKRSKIRVPLRQKCRVGAKVRTACETLPTYLHGSFCLLSLSAPWQITVMSVFFVGHIHFYGQSQYLFGDLGPVVAWPLIMSSTVRYEQRRSKANYRLFTSWLSLNGWIFVPTEFRLRRPGAHFQCRRQE